MRSLFAVILTTVVAISAATALHQPMAAQAPACLHGADATPDQRARRAQALRFVRHVNTLQAQNTRTGGYQPAERLGFSETLPQGFALRLSTDGGSYAFSVIDASDPCRFGFFSDDSGLIHHGEVLR
jgi:hypothetical protein